MSDSKLVLCALSALGGAAVAAVTLKMFCNSSQQVIDPKESKEIYETAKSALQYCEFHFVKGEETFHMKDQFGADMKISTAYDFPIRLAHKFEKFAPRNSRRALDLGSAVGASAFEMSKTFDEVVGIDLSQAFIDKANEMKNKGVLEFECAFQGDIGKRRVAKLTDVCPQAHPERCTFVVGDALNVDPALGKFDALLAANLVCRVPDPRVLLQVFADRINSGGVLVLVSPYSWWAGATNKEKWIGGTPETGRSETVVKTELSKNFELLDEQTEPFFIPDHHRRYQLGFSHCTVWRRK